MDGRMSTWINEWKTLHFFSCHSATFSMEYLFFFFFGIFVITMDFTLKYEKTMHLLIMTCMDKETQYGDIECALVLSMLILL